MDLTAGQQIDRYTVVRQLGSGGVAKVYEVRHRELHATYALKVLVVSGPNIRERLLTEGRVQATLRHRHIVSVTDVVEVEGQPGLVMEFVDGPDLHQFIYDNHPLSTRDIDHIAVGIIKGVRAAHRADHLHRDLKPANVLMTLEDDEWVPKVADFGLAKVLDPAAVGATRTGLLMGTPAYMSPEQARDSKNVDARTDVFALGSLLFELAAGRPAFDGEDVVQILTQVANADRPSIDSLRPDLPERMVLAIEGALVTERDDRIASCDQLLKVWTGVETIELIDSDTFTAHLDAFDLAPSLPDTQEHPSRRAAIALALGGVGVAVATALFVAASALLGAGWYWQQESAVPADELADVTTPRTEQQPEPAAPPDPEAEAGSEPEPEPDPEPKPEPDPEPKPAPDPEPPAPVPPRGPDPRPMPSPSPGPTAPARQPTGIVSLTPDSSVEELWLTQGDARFPLGPVPPGVYGVTARFPGQSVAEPLAATVVTVQEGRQHPLYCDAMSWRCVPR